MAKKDDNFIMLPTVDVCFKGLMYNPKVRKGFIAALLKADPASVRETILLPTALRQEYPDEKLGILDVRTMMEDGARSTWKCRWNRLNTGMPGRCST